MSTSVSATISPLITPQTKPTPVRASSAAGIRQWTDASGNRLPGANTLAKDMEGFAGAINKIQTILKQSPTLSNLNSLINSEVQIINGSNSITLDPISNTLIITNGSNKIVLNPAGPSMTMTTGAMGNQLTFTLAGSVITISGTGVEAGHGNITIDGLLTAANAMLAALTVSGALMAASANITGALVAGSVSTGNVSATSYTASGLPGISVVRTFRNAAGTGTSTDTVTDGIITSYTP